MLRKISIAVARDSSYATASRNLEDLAELKVSAKQCQRVAIRIGNERIDEQQEHIEAYTSATIPSKELKIHTVIIRPGTVCIFAG